ncbi:hypothetical protein TIFTF001_027169 [Ficus carica]|uniref:Glabrous enhancer-binding protein-like DBD domain-containing protein n=1 Tax=Ficus carica TaxID=3494 RepID=A0AA88DMH7_FICCA|nr:hypothetical protein TIFTF001_027169 [Ficus carica]
MAAKRLFEQPPPAYSSSEDLYESDAVDNKEEEEEVEKKNASDNDVARGEKSGGSDEEYDDNDDEEEEKEEEEKVKSPVKKSTVSKPNDSGSSSETESDNTPPSPSLSGFTIEPIVSKPMDVDSVKPKKKAPAKRESEPSEKDSKDKKKRKVASNGGGGRGGGRDDEDPKKASGVALLWTEDDEIALLKGMTDYKAKKGTDPNADMGAFYDFIKEKLNADVSKNKLSEKIRRLKKKYQNNAAKGENGEDPVFSKPHELRSFQLSKKIWGIGADRTASNGSLVEDKESKSNIKKEPVPSTPKSKTTATPTVLALPKIAATVKKEKKREKVQANGKVKSEEEEKQEVADDEVEDTDEEEEEDEFWEKYPFLYESLRLYSMDESMKGIMEKFPLIESSVLEGLNRKWKKVVIGEVECFLRKMELIHEQVKLQVDFMKNM